MTVFVDSGGWLSAVNKADQYYADGRPYLEGLIRARARILTTDFILDEVLTRLRYDVGYRKAVEFLELARRSNENGVLAIASVTPALWKRAEDFFVLYRDVKLSFTDCTSFALLEARPVDTVFGYDDHFEMMGYILAPKP
jgi:predicted nucleic acid-binding protein